MLNTLLALLLCATYAFGCAFQQDAHIQHGDQIQKSERQSSAPMPTVVQSSPTVVQSSATLLVQPSPTPSLFSAAHRVPVPPSIEMRVVDSDVMVRVRPPSISGKVHSIASTDEGVAPTYRPVIVFQFPVIEYLKGGGGNEISVEWPFAGRHTFVTEEEALDALMLGLDQRDTALEKRDAVVFLQMAEQRGVIGATGAIYRFTTFASNDYTLDGNNKPWLPSNQAVSGALDETDEQISYLLEANAVGGNSNSGTITLSELRAKVDSIVAILNEGEGIEGYDECVRHWVHSDNAIAHGSSASGDPTIDEMRSGLPQRTVLPSSEGIWYGGLGYGTWWLSGRDAEYFQIHVTDSPTAEQGYDIDYDENAVDLVSYYLVYTIKRPLPKGAYHFVPQHQWAQWKPCNYNYPDEIWNRWEVGVVAPDGVLHEAFFDPVVDGDAIAAGGSLGKLKPASFTADGVESTIQRIEWASNKVAIRFANPSASLANHHIDFIALDGSAPLRLDFDDAVVAEADRVHSLSWDVCAQPWQSGDLLMLRMAKTDDAGGSVTYGTGCEQGASVTATPSWDQRPAARNLTAEPTHNAVTLEWQSAEYPALTGYRIFRRLQSEGEFALLADLSASETSYTDAGPLVSGVKYIYRVRALPNGSDARIAVTTLASPATATPAPAATATQIPNPTATSEATATSTPDPVATATPTATPEATATPTPDTLASDTPTPTATATIEPTATDTPEPPPSGGVTGQIDTPTPTHTPEPTPTATYDPPPPGGVSGQGDDPPTPTPTSTATNTPEASPTHTPTPAP